MFEPKVKISKDLHGRLRARADAEGYSSVDEYVQHVLEKAAEAPGGSAGGGEDVVSKQLQGLGYID